MKNTIVLNKKEGETPLESLENFRRKNPKYLNVPMTYAGRLDPMASGVLLLLAGEEVKNKGKYLALEKEYEFEVLFGFATDTYDILGKVVSSKKVTLSKQEIKEKIKKHLKSFIGESMQKYPMFSSKTVNGKPLFYYARKGENVKIPEKKIFIKKLSLGKIKELDSKKLFNNIEKRIAKVGGDFRQKDILEGWKDKLKTSSEINEKKFIIISFKMCCSSGTYVRNVANSLGNLIKIPALAFTIKRTKIGKYML